MRKKLFIFLILVWISCLSTAIYWLIVSYEETASIIFCDVAQGDATIIVSGNTQILIDAGRNDLVLDCLDKYIPFWDREIELAIVTHTDSDHIGGFESVLKRYFVKELLVSEYASKTNVFKAFREAVLRERESGMELNIITTNTNHIINKKISLYSLFTRVEGFQNDPYNIDYTETMLWDKITVQNELLSERKLNLNALSVVSFLQIGQVKLLLMGDLDSLREQALVDRGLIADVDVLKVGHHGSKTSTSDQLLATSLPEMAIISVGNNNSYGLPSPQVIDKINLKQIKILRTDHLGDIVIKTDGVKYWLAE